MQMGRVGVLAVMLTALLVTWPVGLIAQTSEADKRARLAAALEMMEVAGSAKQFDQVMPMLAASLAKTFTALRPESAREIREVMAEVAKRFSRRKQEMIDKIAEMYAAELTVDEMKELTRFYSSPVGLKFISIQPKMAQQTMILGQQWGQSIGREIDQEARRELKKRGVDL
jgi:hypothetical protein